MSVTVRRFENASDARAFDKGRFDVIDLAGVSVGRARYEPGWRWSAHVGALSGQASCPVEHVCLVLEGRAAIRMDDGEEVVVGPGDLFHCPAGHDSWGWATLPTCPCTSWARPNTRRSSPAATREAA